MTINKSIIKENLFQLGSIAKQLLPKGKVELALFFSLMIFYLSYSIVLALNTSILDHHEQMTDLFFSFDNIYLSVMGYENIEGHPLLPVFSKPFILLGNWVGVNIGIKVRTILFLLFCIASIALSSVYVYRYLKNILSLDNFPALLFTLFYALFSTNLILSFTTESFTASAFLLSFLVYIYSDYIQKNKKIHFSTHFAFSFLIGGLTITNYSKVVALMLFTKEKTRTIFIKIFCIGGLFFTYLCLIDIWSLMAHRMGILSLKLADGSYVEKVFSLFYGSSIFFSNIKWTVNPYTEDLAMINQGLYSSWWQYLFIGVVLIFIVIAVCKNYKVRLLQALLLVFSVDIVLHTILCLGLDESFIYGGHWVYVVPLFFGWLYHSLNKKLKNIMLIVVCCLFVALIVNNLNELSSFIELAKERYPVSESLKREQLI